VDLFRLGDPEGPGPDVLLLSVWDADVTHHGVYQTGLFDGRRFHLTQKHHLDLGLAYFYAAQSFLDDRGRRILFGWAQEGRPSAAQVEAGWSGVMPPPRQATMTADGRLVQQPVDEVAQLRGHHHELPRTTLQPGQLRWLPEIAGDQLDLELTVDLPPGVGLDLGILSTPDRAEQTVIRLVSEATATGTAILTLDRSASSLDDTVDVRALSGAVPLAAGHELSLRILLDRSIVEIFANGRPLTARVYPTRSDARHLHLTAQRGAATLTSLDAWAMNGIWSGFRPFRAWQARG